MRHLLRYASLTGCWAMHTKEVELFYKCTVTIFWDFQISAKSVPEQKGSKLQRNIIRMQIDVLINKYASEFCRLLVDDLQAAEELHHEQSQMICLV